ncbi:Retrovirus-related Pol polyprotein from transposon TNT 1-94 [Gossypium australe]|uniref:Retrovirus-related Pol polyprotein from transposon TNT 1-94 n=1 Tax=Gossypium australe TaxID=47621 RepID=A0A5B6VIW3_9ROSI|nr:Retrovirus-related Pol polyprotein from transposon TNT 1-94 [Gossypium australe]
MASNSFAPPNPPVFTRENYPIWTMKMKAYLRAFDLWDAVETKRDMPPLRANPTIAQIKQHSDEIQVLNLWKEFEVLKMKESKTVKEYFDRLMNVVNQIRLHGEEFPDKRIVKKVLVSVPERFESKISSLEDSKDISKLTLIEVVNALQALEHRRAIRLEESTEGAFQAKFKDKHGRNNFGKKNNLVRETTKRKKKEMTKKEGIHLILIARKEIILKSFPSLDQG